MKCLAIGVVTLAMAGAAACGGEKKDALEMPAKGSQVTVQKRDGVAVAGRLVEVNPERVIVEQRDGRRTQVPRREISAVNSGDVAGGSRPNAPNTGRAPAESADAANGNGSDGNRAGESAAAKDRSRAEDVPSYREVTIPAGTVLPLELKSAVASDSSHVEDPVRASLRRAVQVGGVEALPVGTAVLGHVTDATPAGRVKGRARVAVRFTEITVPGSGRETIRTDLVARQAAATKKRDAAKIGAGAAGGAIIGGILGGGDGAAKGAAVGGAAGTGVVLSTRGQEVRLGPGADIAVRLTSPLTVRVPMR